MIIFQDDGSPYSTVFNDIYFDTSAGYQQSQAIFINGNNIVSRLQNVTNNFTIAETGFGSGLNLLLTLQAYQKAFKNNFENAPSLAFISTEKYPLSVEQVEKTLALWPDLAELALLLIAQYPEITTAKSENNDYLGKSYQCHFFNNKVSLQLFIDDAADAFAKIRTSKKRTVDAWYLDGFSPNKNPDMWSERLFEQIERLSKEQATLATFTTSGMVKRQLKQHGFRIEKKISDGKKSEFTSAVFQQSTSLDKGYQLRPAITKPQHVAIIGGGIASACAAYLLTAQGVKVTLYCSDNKIAQGASSNAIGALYPLLHQQKDEISEFYQQAFWRAKALYQSLEQQGYKFDHQWCGLLEVSYKASLEKRQALFEQLNAWPKNLIHGVNQQQASELANVELAHGGLFMPEAGWICPPNLVEQLFEAAAKTNRLRIETGIKITQLEQLADNKWCLHSARKKFTESVVVVCAGAESLHLNIANELPLTSVRGQITSMTTNDKMKNLSTVICHKGYLTPANKNQHCIGATFDKNSFDCVASKADDQYNLNMLEQCLPGLTQWQEEDISSAKARLRCMTPDHLPMVGAMPDIEAHKSAYAHLRKDKNWKYQTPAPIINNLYILTGLGARGLCSAPLLAEILAADICGTPYPVDNEQLFNLSPNRFVIRDLIKRKI